MLKPLSFYLEGQGDLACILITPTSYVVALAIPIINFFLSSPHLDPKSYSCVEPVHTISARQTREFVINFSSLL